MPLPGIPTSGFGLRIWGIGKGLESRGHAVTWMMRRDVLARMAELASVPIPAAWHEAAWDGETIAGILDHARPDVIVACGWPTVSALPARLNAPLAVDQAGPHILERYFQQPETAADDVAEKLAALGRADFFSSSGDIQQAYFEGWLGAAGFPRDASGAIDPRTTGIIPFSLSPDLPTRSPHGDRPLTLTYGGYFLPWKDPSAALITAADWAAARGAIVRVFGGRPPFHAVPPGVMGDLIQSLEALPSVEFRGVLPFDTLLAEYRAVDVAIDLMRRNRERELAFTTGTVVYLWAGVPVIYNDYSELSRAITAYDAGWTLDPENAAGLRAVLDEIARDPAIIARKGANAQRLVRERLTWDRTIAPLDAFCRAPFVRAKPAGRKDEAAIAMDPPPAVDSALVADTHAADPALARLARSRRTIAARAAATARALIKRLLRTERVVVYRDTFVRVGPALTGATVIAQRFIAARSVLTAVDVRFATFGRTNTPALTATLAAPGEVERSVTIATALFVDGAYVRFTFDLPLPNAARAQLELTLASPTGVAGDSVAPWLRIAPRDRHEPARRGHRSLAGPLDFRPVYAAETSTHPNR